LGYGFGMTCWRRLRDWNAAGVWHTRCMYPQHVHTGMGRCWSGAATGGWYADADVRGGFLCPITGLPRRAWKWLVMVATLARL
jgi:hypothetical protein